MHAPARIHRPSPAQPAAPAPRAAAPVPRPAPAVAADAAHSFARVSVHPAPVSLQAKLKVGGAGDPHEREAEQVAERVMREAAPAPHRCSCGGTCPTCRAAAAKRKELARAAEAGAAAPATAPPVVHEVLRGPGRPLDAAAAAFLEPRFGHDFGRVRIHADGRAAESARAVGARAYTVGRDVVFGAGEYRPETEGGRRLLAHELTHVLQQDASPSILRRAPAPAPPEPRIPADAPRLEVKMKAESACACVVFIHNNERNARRTASLMHDHCSYNLAIIGPDKGSRLTPGKLDPNSFFTPDVVAECRSNPRGCRDFVRDKAAKPTREWTNKQFFMAVHDCSDTFRLPVVAIHNNVINDTRALRKRLIEDAAANPASDPFKGVPRDLEKPVMEKPVTEKPAKKKRSGEEPPTDPAVLELEAALRKAFAGKKGSERQKSSEGKKIQEALTKKRGSTNIFRWCAAAELSRCHIGDPGHPDNVVWVTDEDDYDVLRDENVNVVLQTGVGDESKGDLSSMFLKLTELIDADPAAQQWAHKPHYVNIETPSRPSDPETTRDEHAVAQYQAIVDTLKPLGLHCCGKDEAETKTGEERIKEGLRTKKKPRAKKK